VVEMGFVILGAILLFSLARAIRAQEPPSVVVEVRDDAAQREESLRHRRIIRGK
jgi:hypothetical protein